MMNQMTSSDAIVILLVSSSVDFLAISDKSCSICTHDNVQNRYGCRILKKYRISKDSNEYAVFRRYRVPILRVKCTCS